MHAPEHGNPAVGGRGRRVVWLLAHPGGRRLAGFLDNVLAGNAYWHLAPPGAVTVGWQSFADPMGRAPTTATFHLERKMRFASAAGRLSAS